MVKPHIDTADLACPFIGPGWRQVRIGSVAKGWRGQDARRERLVLEVAQLLRADRRLPGDQNEFVGRRKLHDFARGQQCARGFLPADHDMCKPGRETVAGIIAHRTLLGRRSEEHTSELQSLMRSSY